MFSPHTALTEEQQRALKVFHTFTILLARHQIEPVHEEHSLRETEKTKHYVIHSTDGCRERCDGSDVPEWALEWSCTEGFRRASLMLHGKLVRMRTLEQVGVGIATSDGEIWHRVFNTEHSILPIDGRPLYKRILEEYSSESDSRGRTTQEAMTLVERLATHFLKLTT